MKSCGTSEFGCQINQKDAIQEKVKMSWPMNTQTLKNIRYKNNGVSDGADNDRIMLGVQFQNKKFMLTLDNILKGKGSQEDLLYGMILKLKEKLSLVEMESQQCTVPRNKLLKIQEVNQNLEKSESKLKELTEKYRKVVVENKDLKRERKSSNEENRALQKEIKELKHLVSLKERSIIGLHEKLELARVNEIRLHSKVELLESMTASKEAGMNVVKQETMDRCAEKISRIKELEEQLSVKKQIKNVKLHMVADIKATNHINQYILLNNYWWCRSAGASCWSPLTYVVLVVLLDIMG